MTYDTILIEHDGTVATITLNRPERLNAAPPAMFEEIGHALDHLDGARAVILTGAGRAFCSGADLGVLGAQADLAETTRRVLTESYNPLMLKLSRLPVPVVSAVSGAAAGIGCSLALAADFCIAGTKAYFLQAFVNIGLIPDGGASWMLARLVGRARATEMMLLGERVPGPRAAEWGLIYRCVADEAVMTEARALAARLAAGPTVAIGLMRQGLADALDGDYASAMAREADNQGRAAGSRDAAEGAQSFAAKRPAVFTGE